MKTFVNGNKLEGKHKNGYLIGHCVLTYKNGDKLEGVFKCSKFTGHCVKTFANGDKIEGIHENKNFTGHCVKTFANGDKIEGIYKDGNFIDHCVKTFANGDKIEGIYKDGNFIAQQHNISIVCPTCKQLNSEFSVSAQTTFSISTDNMCCACLTMPANVFLPTCKHIVLCVDCTYRCKL